MPLPNIDNDQTIESGISFPWSDNSAASYLYYDCTVGVMLDSGIVVHNRLPQVDSYAVDRTSDTLAAVDLDASNIDHITALGVSLKCTDQYMDIVQRMGHSRYWFRLWGQAIRIGYKVPIPRIKTIGGVAAIPYDRNPQWAYNKMAPGGNYSGAILWVARWSLWYTTDRPPTKNDIPAVDPSAHIKGTAVPPSNIQGMQAPYSQADDNAVRGR